ncbi:hydrophobe/amphiphile efflux-1 (HAE1) family protein [Roseovarius nanhaiticus]|uniref:Hydrophobe/amphiphile efflux-1 (HAE1) family protein n=1 Tax=Roseovarius nanhaiticus TaxID=573024 RepID=A0A1N7FCE9_9RHOB|nr:efflux RND transporter permease subunit [Roseovarius nanhaiticus]SEK57507.1 hydrophobe/amphiphile efflux-1 (HAE1) family protein [Roseovarius nanhaiticus]SIR98031.1 hydrophobe/amphiphile efflux-1 (HAE1) family protein [Roseovarius nanhaiticus]
MSGERPDTGGISALSVRRPWLAAVMNLLIVIAGIGALWGVEIRELPDIDRPIVSVRANYPGASPTTLDAEVASLVEGAVARVAGVTSVETSSEEGNFRMRAEFSPSRDLDTAASDVREAVARIETRLPDGVEDLFVVKSEQDADPILDIAIWSEARPIDQLTRLVDDSIIPEFTAVPGVAEVVVFGDRQRVLRVEVAPERLAAFGLSIAEVADTLRAAQFDVPVGSFGSGQLEVLVRADATVTDPARIEELKIRQNIRLGDVSDVYFGLATAESVARLDGRMVLNLGIVRQAQSNTVQISDDVRRAIEALRLRYPELGFEITSDSAVFIKGSIAEVAKSLAFALLIVIGVIWLFFGKLRTVLIPAVTIPIALTGSLAAIWLLGFSVNLITLLSLVLATGLVVDDAIVVTENIQRKRQEGLGRRAAAAIGAREVFFAVIATTATLIAVFVPISFLPSDAGRLFTEFGFVLAITVAISSFVALTMCPMLASLTADMGGGTGPLARLGGWLSRGYMALIGPMVRAPLVTLVAASLIAGSAALVYGQLGEELLPDEDRGEINVWIQGPDGTGLDYTDAQVERVEAMMQPFVESGAASSLYSITGRYDLNRGSIGLRLAPWSERTISQAEIEAEITPQLSGLAGAQGRAFSSNSLGLRGSAGGLSIALTGPSYPEIAEAADSFSQALRDVAGLSDIRVQYQATQPQLNVLVDRARASDLGVEMETLSTTLRALIDEDEIAELTIQDEAVPIILQSSAGAVRDPADLMNLYVRSDAGDLVPLSQLVSLEENGVAAELDRHAQRRAIELDASVSPDTPLRGIIDDVRALAAEELPGEIGLIFLGEAASLDETSSALTATYVIALIVVFLVLLAQFESLTSALVVMTTVPFGICAAIYALLLTGTTINIYSQIGVLMLVGVMAKNGILLVEFADQLRDKGASASEAALEAARVRLRPISMTLICTVMAGLPLILGSGPGAEARAAIGWVIFGGLGLAAAFTLFLTPAAYALIAAASSARAAAGEALEAELRDA